ncbi:MAG: hypothetical protein BGN84_01150 [Afipia sp. 62-7]|nr:porin family protein [Afipia sp.]OJU18512.1 MAG: hypothetical protein BGN84_01150 [Afipia sp. 62-7]
MRRSPTLAAILAASSLTVSAGSLSAADLAPRVFTKAPVPVSAYDWSGFYIGGHLGMAGSKTCLNQVSPTAFAPDTGCQSAHGVLGGGQIGYNIQYSNFVFGAEFSASGLDVAGRHTPPAGTNNDNLEITADTGALLMLTGRAGMTWNNNILAYVKGGGAWTRNNYSFIENNQPTINVSASRSGWTIGGGVEYGFHPNWTLGIEYNHVDFGSSDLTLQPGWIIAADQKIDIVTARINYRFAPGWRAF